MRIRTRSVVVAFLAFAVLVPFSMAPAFAAPADSENGPSDIIGTWDVVHVAVDPSDQPHWLYYPDDPRLLGRTLLITHSEASLNDGARSCLEVEWSAETTDPNLLVASSFPRTSNVGTPPAVSLKDLGLADEVKPVQVVRATCRYKGQVVNVRPWSSTWFVRQNSRNLLMRYGTSALLVFQLRAPDQPYKPSFDCQGELNSSEHAICQHLELAAFDRSVAAAYGRAKSLRPGELARLRLEQTKWVAERNSCAADAACLLKTMRERVQLLMQE